LSMIPKTMDQIPMVTKLGTISHAMGFVIDKLREQRRFGGSHVPVQFLSGGYPPQWRHLITQAIDALENEGIIRVENKRTGRGSGPHARLVKNALARKRGLLNAFRRAKGLPTFGRDLKTLLPVRRRGSAPPTTR
jgi:hypothetical protein